MRVESRKLRGSARGKTCTLHLPCGQKGMGMKSPDQMAVFACHSCHMQLDGAGRWDIHARDYLRALAETQGIWIRDGLMKIEGVA